MVGDLTGFTFFITTMAMMAATVFFFVERNNVQGKWKLSLTVSGLITLIAAVHYYYMRDIYDTSGDSPTEIRYIDWVLTVPLMCVEFYLILAAVGKASVGILVRLIAYSVVMLVTGYIGEIMIPGGGSAHWIWFGIGCVAWLLIVYEIFAGEASKISAASASGALQSAFGALRLFVLIGWIIYPIGYILGALSGGAPEALNVAYNIADAVNKIGFGLVIYVLAYQDSHQTASA